ncbi:MAG: signal peptidase II [Ruminococcaceae bacterium]|nr:signal peptidase II [Oscillospiraceae bacterium]
MSTTENRKISVRVRVISFFAVLALLGIDQLIKYFVDLCLKNRPAVTVIRNVLQLNYLENDGAMMGFMGGKTALMTTLAVICVAVMLVVIFSGLIKDRVDYWCCLFMIAGGLGNIIDRAFRGYVIDYIEVLFVDFYIFNFADCLITVAAFVLIFYQLFLTAKENKRKKAGDNP